MVIGSFCYKMFAMCNKIEELLGYSFLILFTPSLSCLKQQQKNFANSIIFYVFFFYSTVVSLQFVVRLIISI